MISSENFLFAMALTLFAGLATGVGSLLAFFSRRSDKKFLSFILGFSAGVMIYIALSELLAESRTLLAEVYASRGSLLALACFFGGVFLALAIDRLIPEGVNPHEVKCTEELGCPADAQKLSRSGLVMALVLALHNFPEGMATFMAAVSDVKTGLSIAIAVAIHNIPEGITVSVPVYQATGSRKKAFLYSFGSGLAEPAGAILAALVLLPFLSEVLLSCIFAAVAGIMVYISFDELLPLSEEYGCHHLSIYGVISGMAVMAISLL